MISKGRGYICKANKLNISKMFWQTIEEIIKINLPEIKNNSHSLQCQNNHAQDNIKV